MTCAMIKGFFNVYATSSDMASLAAVDRFITLTIGEQDPSLTFNIWV